MDNGSGYRKASKVFLVLGLIILLVCFPSLLLLNILGTSDYVGLSSYDFEELNVTCSVSYTINGLVFFILSGVFSSKATKAEMEYFDKSPSYNSDFWAKNSPNGSKNTKANQKLNQAMSSATWRCPVCSSVNASYVGICDCGARKPSLTVNNPSSTTSRAKVTASAVSNSKPVSDRPVAPIHKEVASVVKTPDAPVSAEDTSNSSSVHTADTPKIQFCPYCGEKMTERTVFCCVCGQKLK